MGNEKKKSIQYLEYCFVGIALILSFYIFVSNLTSQPHWYDETVEYYYSKYMFGLVPDGNNYTNMYQRITSTFQPPLYNILMFVWLNIADSEWWFRFFGVIAGMISVLGVYKTVREKCNYLFSSATVVLLACTKKYVYYLQECSEYCLMLAILPWVAYFWIRAEKKKDVSSYIRFMIVGLLASYSQYGALLVVFSFTSLSFISLLNYKDRDYLKSVSIINIFSLLLGYLPLWMFFANKQIQNQKAFFTDTMMKMPKEKISESMFGAYNLRSREIIPRLWYKSLTVTTANP